MTIVDQPMTEQRCLTPRFDLCLAEDAGGTRPCITALQLASLLCRSVRR